MANTLSQSYAIHFNRDDAVVGLAPRGLLQGELYEVMVVGEDHGLQASCARKVGLILRSQHPFFVGRSGLHAAPPQALGNSKICVSFV